MEDVSKGLGQNNVKNSGLRHLAVSCLEVKRRLSRDIASANLI